MSNPVKSETGKNSADRPDIIDAAYRGDFRLVSELIQSGVDPNTVDSDDNLSLLHIAGLQGDYQLAEVILSHHRQHGGIDFSTKSRLRPRLAWQYAMNANHADLALLILRASKGMTLEGPVPTV